MSKELTIAICAALCGIQLVGISAAAIAATTHIETIGATGPCFSTIGLAVAFGSLFSRSPLNLLFGLSALAFSLCIFGLIYWYRWSPPQGAVPISWLILGYVALAVPLGLGALYATLAPKQNSSQIRNPQFKLRSLFILTFIVSLVFGAARTFIHFDANFQRSIALLLLLLTLTGIGITLWLSLRQHLTATS